MRAIGARTKGVPMPADAYQERPAELLALKRRPNRAGSA